MGLQGEERADVSTQIWNTLPDLLQEPSSHQCMLKKQLIGTMQTPDLPESNFPLTEHNSIKLLLFFFIKLLEVFFFFFPQNLQYICPFYLLDLIEICT